MEQKELKTSEARRKAIYKYDTKFEQVNCKFIKGTKSRIEKLGYKSINDFIKLEVNEKLEHDEKILKKNTKKLLTYKAQRCIMYLTNKERQSMTGRWIL